MFGGTLVLTLLQLDASEQLLGVADVARCVEQGELEVRLARLFDRGFDLAEQQVILRDGQARDFFAHLVVEPLARLEAAAQRRRSVGEVAETREWRAPCRGARS